MHTNGLSESNGKSIKVKPAVKRTRTSTAAKTTLHLKSKDADGVPTVELRDMIATAAYFCAERRHFEPGHELEDWLLAESQVRAAVQPNAQHDG